MFVFWVLFVVFPFILVVTGEFGVSGEYLMALSYYVCNTFLPFGGLWG